MVDAGGKTFDRDLGKALENNEPRVAIALRGDAVGVDHRRAPGVLPDGDEAALVDGDDHGVGQQPDDPGALHPAHLFHTLADGGEVEAEHRRIAAERGGFENVAGGLRRSALQMDIGQAKAHGRGALGRRLAGRIGQPGGPPAGGEHDRQAADQSDGRQSCDQTWRETIAVSGVHRRGRLRPGFAGAGRAARWTCGAFAPGLSAAALSPPHCRGHTRPP